MSFVPFYLGYTIVAILLLSVAPFAHEYSPLGAVWVYLWRRFSVCECRVTDIARCTHPQLSIFYYVGCVAFPATAVVYLIIGVCSIPRVLARLLKKRRQGLPSAKVVNK